MEEQETARDTAGAQRVGPVKRPDPLLRLIGVVAVGVALLMPVAFFFQGEGPIVVIPWFIPMMNGFLVLVATCVAFLAFGRHRVLGESASFWVGVGFSAFAVGMLFNVLTWPALLPGGSSILGHASNTAAWVATVGLQLLGISLLLAVLVPWPQGPRWTAHTWRWSIAGWMAFLVGLNLLFVVYEHPWPRVTSSEGRFLPLHVAFSGVGLGLETLAGAILSTLHYRRRRDALLGHVTICQLTLFSVALFTALQDRRFDTWWYVQRALWAAGFLTMLFGLLFEYVQLFRREQERSAELAALNRELRASERVLRDSEERFRALVEATAQVVWTTDAEGRAGEDSPSWRAFTGQSLQEYLQGGAWNAVHPGDRERVETHWRQALATRRPYELEYRLQHHSGDYRWTLARAVPLLNPDGTLKGWVGMHTDITERKQAEEELRALKDRLELRVQERTADLMTANQELESFAYTVSHDLRTPLRHVTTFVGFLRDRLGTGLDETSREFMDTIAQGAGRMDTLIENLLMLSRLDRADLRETAIGLGQLVEEAQQEVMVEAKERPIEWHIGPLPTVRGDAALLRSVVVNLLGNAVKYTRGRTPARIEVGGEERNSEVVVFVHDNGAGFDMKFAPRLFGAFQRLHTTKQFEGTGVGLASVRRIIQRHGGRTWAEGAVGQGATFYFSLPRERCVTCSASLAPANRQ